MKSSKLPSFEPITSIPLSLVNYSIGFIFILPILLLFVSGFAFVSEDNIEAALFVFILGSITFILVLALVFFGWKKAYTTIRIDDKGIHYFNNFNGKVIKRITWNQIIKRKINPSNFYEKQYDVKAVLPYRGIHAYFIFEILIDKKAIMYKEIFHGNHLFCILYNNRLELIRTFLLGLRYFRSDLIIDPQIFEDHFIDQKTFMINYKKRAKFFILISMLILLFAIFLWLLID